MTGESNELESETMQREKRDALLLLLALAAGSAQLVGWATESPSILAFGKTTSSSPFPLTEEEKWETITVSVQAQNSGSWTTNNIREPLSTIQSSARKRAYRNLLRRGHDLERVVPRAFSLALEHSLCTEGSLLPDRLKSDTISSFSVQWEPAGGDIEPWMKQGDCP